VRADRRVSDNGTLRAGTSRPLVTCAIPGFQRDVLRSCFAEIDQETRRTLEGVVKYIILAGGEARGAQRLPGFVGELCPRITPRLGICGGK